MIASPSQNGVANILLIIVPSLISPQGSPLLVLTLSSVTTIVLMSS